MIFPSFLYDLARSRMRQEPRSSCLSRSLSLIRSSGSDGAVLYNAYAIERVALDYLEAELYIDENN